MRYLIVWHNLEYGTLTFVVVDPYGARLAWIPAWRPAPCLEEEVAHGAAEEIVPRKHLAVSKNRGFLFVGVLMVRALLSRVCICFRNSHLAMAALKPFPIPGLDDFIDVTMGFQTWGPFLGVPKRRITYVGIYVGAPCL